MTEFLITMIGSMTGSMIGVLIVTYLWINCPRKDD